MTRPHEGTGEAGAPGLAIHRQSSPGIPFKTAQKRAEKSTADAEGIGNTPDPGGGCPERQGWVMVNTATGQVVPARCGRNRCPHCLGLNAFRRSRAVAAARPPRVILLTEAADRDDPNPWPTVRYCVNKTREYLRRDGIDPGWWAYFVERGEDTGMVHVHVAQHGPDKIPKEALNEAAFRAGTGFTSVNKMRQRKGFSQYVGKGFATYVGKGFTAEQALDNLALNGHRLGHFSRGFFVSEAGASIGVREAERQAMKAAGDDDGIGSWVFMREDAAA